MAFRVATLLLLTSTSIGIASAQPQTDPTSSQQHAAALSAAIAAPNVQASRVELAQVEGHIQDGLSSKGHVLTRNHALALRGLTLDNAFLDMQRLIEQAVHDEPDLVYGIFINSEREALGGSRRSVAAGDPAGNSRGPSGRRAAGRVEVELRTAHRQARCLARLEPAGRGTRAARAGL
jgi:hypothetical protein